MPTVNSRISLSLAEKLRIIFEKDDKFLVFPTGVGFGYRELAFMQDLSTSGISALEQANFKGQFARLLNIIPDDSPAYSADATLSLWGRTVDILKDSIFAVSALNATEEARLTEAIDFLTDPQMQMDGTTIPVNSVAVTKYYEYKVQYDNAMNDYVDAKTTAESATGPGSEKIKQDWAAFKNNQMKSVADTALQNWKNLGSKIQVENYQAIRNDLEVKKYLLLYKMAYLNEIDLAEISDPNNQGLGAYLTYFSPYDAFNKNQTWPSITLTKQEVNSLVQSASSAYKNIFADGGSNDDFESVIIEYNNVTIMKPWFKPEFFSSGYWKLPENKIVSDGGAPRRGMIPAYITSMIVVRSIKIVRKKDAQSKPFYLPILANLSLQVLKTNGAILNDPKITERKTVRRIDTPVFKLQDLKPKAEPVKPIIAPTRTFTMAQPQMAAFKPAPSFSSAAKLSTSAIKPSTSLVTNLNLASLATIKTPVASANYTKVKYTGTVIKSPLYIPTTPAPTTSTELITETFPLDGVMVVAYVCKRVQKSPSPDVSLQW